MKNGFKSIFVAMIIMTLMVSVVSAKSLYVIADINAYQNIPINAYDIQSSPTYLSHQYTSTIPDRNGGAVGLAIDSDSGYLFASFEFSGVIDLIDGTTMTSVGQVTAPGATNLAGVVVDHDKNRLYAVDRNTNHLYVYDWDSTGPTLTLIGLTYVTLDCNAGLYGIALDEANDLLYVGDSTNVVKYYNTADWTRAGQFTIGHNARGMALDEPNQIIYSCAGGPSGATTLSKYNIGTSTESVKNIGSVTLGAAVDQDTGFVYITTYGGGAYGDNLLALDTSFNIVWQSGDLGNPTGLTIPGRGDVSYNPLQFSKADEGVCQNDGDTFTYTLAFNNPNVNPVSGITIVDQLPAEVDFVSATNGGVYDPVFHTVTWTYGSLAAQTSDSVSIDVLINGPFVSFTNSATIDSDNTPQTTKSDSTKACQQQGEVPEFGTIGIIATILGASVLVSRKRRK